MLRRWLCERGVVTPVGSADLWTDQRKGVGRDLRGLHVAAGMRAAKFGWRWRRGHVSNRQEPSRTVQRRVCETVPLNGLLDTSGFDAVVL